MNRLIKYIIIALVQGIGEILPISSSGHMIIVTRLLSLEPDLSFEIFLHFASLLAIIIYFRKLLIELIKDFFLFIFKREKINANTNDIDKEKALKQKNNFMTCIYLIIATIPVGIFGILFDEIIEEKLSTFLFVGIALFITALMLFIISFIKRERKLEDMKWYDALIIGIFQCIGALPGISRSGSCITGCSCRKINQKDAANFAFLLAIPVMAGSAILKVKDIFVTLTSDKTLILPYTLSFIVTFIVTFLCLVFIFKYIKKIKMAYFSIYCCLIGIICIICHFLL